MTEFELKSIQPTGTGGKKRLKILISAYACEPGKGSEPAVGWNIAQGMAALHEVWVLTRANNRPLIEAELAARPVPNLHFIYHDLPHWARIWKRGRRGVQVYYYLWQLMAISTIKDLHSKVHFDLAHHISIVKYWAPTCLSFLPIPFIWGPVGGGEDAPRSFWLGFGVAGLAFEIARSFARWIAEHDPIVRLAAERCALAFVTTPQTVARVRGLGACRIEIMSALTLAAANEPAMGPNLKASAPMFPSTMFNAELAFLMSLSHPPNTGTIRFISIGNLVPYKGTHLSLRAFALANLPNAELWIIGDGRQRQRLDRLSRRLGIAHLVSFLGRKTRSDTFKAFADCHVLLFPSLHESGGFVCLEAMAAGRPVICLDLGGPQIIVSKECGIRCPVTSPSIAVAKIAEAMRLLCKDPSLRDSMGRAGRQRIIDKFLRGERVRFYSDCYHRVLKGTE